MRLDLRHLIVVVFLAAFAVGMSSFVVISNTMAIEMAAPTASNAALMDCVHLTTETSCAPDAAHCPTGCAVPDAVLPLSAEVVLAVDAVYPGAAARANERVGIDLGPHLPPPRTSHIA